MLQKMNGQGLGEGVRSVERPTLGFGSAHVTVCGFKPRVGLRADSTEPAWDPLFLPFCLPLPAHTHSLKNRHSKKKKENGRPENCVLFARASKGNWQRQFQQNLTNSKAREGHDLLEE